MKSNVAVTVKVGQRNYGFALVVEGTPQRIESALEDAYGKDNIVACIIRERGSLA